MILSGCTFRAFLLHFYILHFYAFFIKITFEVFLHFFVTDFSYKWKCTKNATKMQNHKKEVPQPGTSWYDMEWFNYLAML